MRYSLEDEDGAKELQNLKQELKNASSLEEIEEVLQTGVKPRSRGRKRAQQSPWVRRLVRAGIALTVVAGASLGVRWLLRPGPAVYNLADVREFYLQPSLVQHREAITATLRSLAVSHDAYRDVNRMAGLMLVKPREQAPGVIAVVGLQRAGRPLEMPANAVELVDVVDATNTSVLGDWQVAETGGMSRVTKGTRVIRGQVNGITAERTLARGGEVRSPIFMRVLRRPPQPPLSVTFRVFSEPTRPEKGIWLTYTFQNIQP